MDGASPLQRQIQISVPLLRNVIGTIVPPGWITELVADVGAFDPNSV